MYNDNAIKGRRRERRKVIGRCIITVFVGYPGFIR